MKKHIITLGIILILAGLVVLSVQGIPHERTIGNDKPHVIRDDSWNIPPTSFKEGEILRVDFRVGPNWAFPPHEFTTIDGVEFPLVKLFIIKVIDDANSSSYTEFDIVLVCPPAPYDPSKISLHPKIEVMHHGPLLVGVYTENKTGIVKYFSEVMGGIVRRDGNYTVETELYPYKVQNITPENKTEWIDPDPPVNLYLYKVIIERTYPYKFLLAASPITMGTGVFALVLGFWNDKRKAVHKKTLKRARNTNKS